MKVQKKVGGILRDRLFIGGVLLLAQLILMIVLINTLSGRWSPVYQSFIILSIIMVIWLVRKHDNPAYKIAWIIVILIFPLFGGIFYLFWGNTPFNRARKMHQMEPLHAESFNGAPIEPVTAQADRLLPRHVRHIRYIERTCTAPLWRNTQSEYFPSGEAQFASMKIELEKAERFIFLEYFILEEGEMWNTILDILVRKAQQGVDVRVLYDDAGSISKLPRKYDAYLKSLGLRVVRFNPFVPTLNTYLNNRDHRKICVIDGNVGYMGGINLADEYINKVVRFGYWKDTAVLLRGQAVANMTAMFLQLWNFTADEHDTSLAPYLPTLSADSDGYIQPFGDSPLDEENAGEIAYMQIINNAQRYVYITTPYLVIDNEMMIALCTAAKSGIDVRIITPGIPDKPAVYAVTRSYYQQLIEAGVRIYEYRPGFVHAKMFVSDDDVAVVGTINMDFRSFFLHFECGAVFYEGTMPTKVRTDIEHMFEESREIDLEWCHRMPWPVSIASSILRVFAPLL